MANEYHILTCRHVVWRAVEENEDGSGNPEYVKVDFPFVREREFYYAQIIEENEAVDLAKLALEGSPPVGAFPAPISPTIDLWNHRCRVLGPKGEVYVWADAIVKAENPNGWIQIETDRSTGYSIQQGFSGSPVWDIRLGAVVGLIIAVDTDPEVRVAYMITAVNLLSLIVDLDRPHQGFYTNHNLPPRQRFVDRLGEKAKIIRFLNDPRGTTITLEGMGGIGKTVLAIESAYDCILGTAELVKPISHVVFISAKSQELNIEILSEAIAQVLGVTYISRVPGSTKVNEIYRLLRNNRILIIADNLETVNDEDVVEFLNGLPEPTKLIGTTRRRKPQLRSSWTIPLVGLEREDALGLLRSEAVGLGLEAFERIRDEKIDPLIQITNGNPFALVASLGYIGTGIALDRIVRELSHAEGQIEVIFDNIFELIWDTLHDSARKIMMSLTFFADSASRAAISFSCGIDDNTLDSMISQLSRSYLVNVYNYLDESEQRFSAHPLTLAFCRKKIREHQYWEQGARRKWVEWHLNFAIEHKGADWWEGYLKDYDLLNTEWQNLRSVFDWTNEQEAYYPLIKAFWLDEDLTEFIKSYDYWNDRVKWLTVINERARREENKHDYLLSASGLIWTFSRLGDRNKLVEAERLADRAWAFRDEVRPEMASKLADNIAVLKTYGGKWAEAANWFEIATDLLEVSGLDNEKKSRRRCHILYYQAHQWQREGALEVSEETYRVGLRHAIDGRWNRAVIFFKNRLAEISLAKGQIEAAEQLLVDGLSLYGVDRHKRALGHYYKTYAYVERLKGDFNSATEYGRRALTIFRQIGMEELTNEMEAFLESKESSQFESCPNTDRMSS